MSKVKEIKGKILLDAEENNPILDFNQYVEAIFNIIQNSDPNFSIGIYGEWGTGKTTLMSAIKKKIENSNTNQDGTKIIPVWFNAWRYEREENQATIPLMKTIAYTLEEYPVFKPISDKIKKAVWAGVKEVGKKLISKHVADVNYDKIKEDYDNQIDKFPDIEKDTIFYDGLEQIKQEIIKIRKDPEYRIVVFIDDLDRCSPKKTLEVFESIKAFLDISGLIFVIGLSFKAISDLITKQYEGSGIKGEDYIKKIIQVPIFVQEWNASDTSKLIKNISDKLVDQYKKIIGDDNNAELLSIALEKNPREIKRFINTFIISNEIYSKTPEETAELLLVRALKWRWPKVYNRFSHNKEFRDEIDKVAGYKESERSDYMAKDDPLGESSFQEEIKELSSDSDFWTFVSQANIIFKITDWEKYRRATAVTDEKSHSTKLHNASPNAQEEHRIVGLSLLGGEPFAQVEAAAELACRTQNLGLDVMVYTGFELADLRARGEPAVDTLLEHTDLLVDGPFDRNQPDRTRRWIGSRNQQLHRLSDRYTADDPRFVARETVEIRLRAGELVINGKPWGPGLP